MGNNFHAEPFDEATALKLDIYGKYLKQWLPVFIQANGYSSWESRINIFDFFSGPGRDANGEPGSPIIFINTCLEFSDSLKEKNKKVSLYFNDKGKNKIKALDQELLSLSLPCEINCCTSNHVFSEAFTSSFPIMRKSANLIFIDQCGIKEVNKPTFKKLIDLPQTDFLFFISSSAFQRFANSSEFKKHMDPRRYIKETPYTDTHRAIANMYRAMVPPTKEYYLAPFSLKKKANIYGLIFGSSNLLGILKFLEICWKVDPERGEANFDIDRDDLPGLNQTLSLFDENEKSSKVTKFQEELEEKLISGEFSSDKEVFSFTLTNGFLPVRHAKEVITKLIKSKQLTCTGTPRMSKLCIKEPRAIKPY